MNVNELQIIGFGGSGANILNQIKELYPNVYCIELTAYKKDLETCNADKCMLLGKDGFGCGLDLELGKIYIQEKQQEILDSIDLTKNTVLVSGLGGGCSSGSLLECCSLLTENNKDFFTLVSIPFNFESETRLNTALYTISTLLKSVNKEKLYLIDSPAKLKGKTLREAFKLLDKNFVEQLEKI